MYKQLQGPIKGRMDQQNVVCAPNAMLFSLEREGGADRHQLQRGRASDTPLSERSQTRKDRHRRIPCLRGAGRSPIHRGRRQDGGAGPGEGRQRDS